MGRTNRTYRQHLEQFFEQLRSFRKELRSDEEHFTDLEEKAYSSAHAASQLNSTSPGMPAFLSILLGLQKQLNELEERVEELED
ncbi:MAG: hypothetical protein ABEJ56_06440 [Candidatus Nanohaloarchaea archaeon]